MPPPAGRCTSFRSGQYSGYRSRCLAPPASRCRRPATSSGYMCSPAASSRTSPSPAALSRRSPLRVLLRSLDPRVADASGPCRESTGKRHRHIQHNTQPRSRCRTPAQTTVDPRYSCQFCTLLAYHNSAALTFMPASMFSLLSCLPTSSHETNCGDP